MAKTKKITSDDIIHAYMDYLLENAEPPKNMHMFSKELGMKERDVYIHFASFEAIEKASFDLMVSHTHTLLEKDPSFNEYDPKNKLLSYHYTFFELLKANRTYVMMILNPKTNSMRSLRILSGLRKHYKEFVGDLGIETMDLKNERLEKIKNKGFKEMAWNQFLATLYYWMKDDSPSFEKTDIFIEKSLNASFDLLHVKPIESIMDLGKFLIKDNLSF